MKAELGVTTFVTEPTEDSYDLFLFGFCFPPQHCRISLDFRCDRAAIYAGGLHLRAARQCFGDFAAKPL